MTDEGLTNVPHAEGVNNHMGSAATSDLRVMRTLMGHLKKKNLYFIDSKVIPSSVAERAAKEKGLLFACRDVFIDNQLMDAPIKSQIRKAVKMALKKGKVIMIGHAHRITLKVLKEILPEIDRAGVRLVFVRQLVKR